MEPKDQAIENLLIWARTACEEVRAKIGYDDDNPDKMTPSWLPELENAITELENAE